jgi:hypothetical protein
VHVLRAIAIVPPSPGRPVKVPSADGPHESVYMLR